LGNARSRPKIGVKATATILGDQSSLAGAILDTLTVKLRKLNLKEKESNRTRLCLQAGCARRKTLPLTKS
jgi:hypothetical protein